MADSSSGTNFCVYSEVYLSEQAAEDDKNRPKVPPFMFVGTYLILILVLYFINNKAYPYVYHFGYFLGLHSIFDITLLAYGVLSIN